MYCSHALEDLISNDSSALFCNDKSIEMYLWFGMALSKTKHGLGRRDAKIV
jgi:hypothetical protein